MTKIWATYLAAIIITTAVVPIAAESRDSLPPVSFIVSTMEVRAAARSEMLSSYTVLRRYEVTNRHRHAEMLVRMTCTADGERHFTILDKSGSEAIRKHVFRKMLKEEARASSSGTRSTIQISPKNYLFRLVGMDSVDGRPAYVLEVTPRAKRKYLIRGRIWVDAADFAISRVEGSPAKKPSFWTRSVHFLRKYKKVGPLWLAQSTNSVTDVRIFGSASLSITDFDYLLSPSATSLISQLPQGGLQP